MKRKRALLQTVRMMLVLGQNRVSGDYQYQVLDAVQRAAILHGLACEHCMGRPEDECGVCRGTAVNPILIEWFQHLPWGHKVQELPEEDREWLEASVADMAAMLPDEPLTAFGLPEDDKS